jgi:hypothetical protein
LRLTKNVKRALARIPLPMWEGQPTVGMEQIAGTVVQLDGWSRARRVVFIRTMKPANPSAQDVFWGTEQEEVAAYVTSLPSETASSGQIVMLYRKRADAEPTKGNRPPQGSPSGRRRSRVKISSTSSRTSGALRVFVAARPWSLKWPPDCCF